MTSCSAQTQEGNGGGYVRPLTYFLSIQKKIKWDEDMFGPNSSKPGTGSCPASHLFSERQKKNWTGSCSAQIQKSQRRGHVRPLTYFLYKKIKKSPEFKKTADGVVFTHHLLLRIPKKKMGWGHARPAIPTPLIFLRIHQK